MNLGSRLMMETRMLSLVTHLNLQSWLLKTSSSLLTLGNLWSRLLSMETMLWRYC